MTVVKSETRLSFILLIAVITPVAVRSAAPEPNEAALLANLKWRSIGPANMGGRVTAIEGVPGDSVTFYVGGADGGIFKTTNGGTTFKALFDNQAVLSIGAITIAPSDPNVIWVSQRRVTTLAACHPKQPIRLIG